MKKICAILISVILILTVATACSASFKTETKFLEGQSVTITMNSKDGYSFDTDGADIDFVQHKDVIANGTFYKQSYLTQNKIAIEAGYDNVEEGTKDSYAYTIYQCKSNEASPQYTIVFTYGKSSHLIVKTDKNIDTIKEIISCLTIE